MKKEFLEPYPVCKEKESLVEEQIYLLIFPVATIFAKGYTVIQKRRIKRNEQIMRKIILGFCIAKTQGASGCSRSEF